MTSVAESPSPGKRTLRRGLELALLSLVVGTFAGLIGAAFRLLLARADTWRTHLIEHAKTLGWIGFPLVLLSIVLLGAFAAWLVPRFAPHASGSGIPQIERETRSAKLDEPPSILLVKFIGGLASIGGGFALGREGPTVQMGGSIGQFVGRAFGRDPAEARALLAAGAGAGLATAFNAPIAGAVFVLEEILGSFDVSVSITTLGASVAAICVSRVFLGESPDFHVPELPFLRFGVLPLSLFLGVLLGFAGVAYNRLILASLRWTARFDAWNGTIRAATIGALVAILGWFGPHLIGGGDDLTQRILNGNLPVLFLVSVLLLRFLLGPLSYAARTPGGLFAPMLVVGAMAGLLFHVIWMHLWPGSGAVPQQFAIAGMAGLFAASVRAPLTGIILAVELTGSFSLLLPMLGVAFAATATADFLGEPPIYDSLYDAH